ncbi:MAG: hypothetical protein WAM04_02265 [Candidatus Sulfotelmatobacter sp.]
MSVKKRSVFVILAAALVVCALPWLLLVHGDAAKIGSNPLFPSVVAFFALLPLYPLYRLANQWPRFRVGIGIIAVNGLLCALLAFLYFGLHLDSVWLNRMFDVSQVLLLGGCLLLVWQGARSHRQDNHRL